MSQGPITNPSLLVRLREPDDASAWDTFLELYEPLVFGFCRKRGLQEADARDVTQDVLHSVITAIKKLEYDRSKGTFRGWLFQVARSKLANYFKKNAKQARGTGQTVVHQMLAEQPAEELEQEWDEEVEKRLFNWACQQIRPQVETSTWDAFWQNAVENKPAVEVAKSVDISVGAVYIAKSRVISRIRTLIHEVSEFD